MGCGRRRRRDISFEDRIVGGRQRVSVVTVRSAVEGRIDGADVRALTYPPTFPIGVAVKDFEIHLTEAMSSVGAVLHNRGLVVPIIEFGGRLVLLEAEVALSAGFSYVGGIGFTGLVVCSRARCKIDDASFFDGS